MKSMTFTSEFLSAAKQAPRIYFAPLVGAYKAIKAEMAKAGGGDRSTKTTPSTDLHKEPADRAGFCACGLLVSVKHPLGAS